VYSPLFIRCCAANHNLSVTAKGVKKRSRQRFEKRKQLSKMATVPAETAMSGVKSDLTAIGKPQEPWRENLNMQVICRDCKEFPPNLVEEFSSGDMVCGSCGLVLGDRIIDTRSEWRTFSNDDQGNDDPSRVGDGANPLLNGSQLQTTISFGDGAANHKSRDLHRAQNKSTHDKSTKSLLAAYKEIGALCDALSLMKNVSDVAKHLFKMVNDAGAFKGKSQDTLIAGVIFIACRQCSLGRTFREIYALTKVPKAEIGRMFKNLEKFFAKQNKEKLESLVRSGGKLIVTELALIYLLLILTMKGSSTPMRNTIPPNQLVQRNCVRDIAATSDCPMNALRCRRPLPKRWKMLDHSLGDPRSLLRQHVSTWHRTCWQCLDLPKIYRQWRV